MTCFDPHFLSRLFFFYNFITLRMLKLFPIKKISSQKVNSILKIGVQQNMISDEGEGSLAIFFLIVADTAGRGLPNRVLKIWMDF